MLLPSDDVLPSNIVNSFFLFTFHKFDINKVKYLQKRLDCRYDLCAFRTRIKANMFSTKQNSHKYVFDITKHNQGKNMLPQTFARNLAFTQILDLLNILLFQNTVDFVCLVIQRYSSKEKMRHSITQHCFNQMLLPFSKRFIQQPY